MNQEPNAQPPQEAAQSSAQSSAQRHDNAAAFVQQPADGARDPRPTNENPNFVHDYFRQSRLHFIGSFRARYESMMVAVGNRLSVNPSLLLQSSTHAGQAATKRRPCERVIVHIDMDAFFASVAVRDNPNLVGLPIAVCHGGGEVSTCSYEARKFGIRAGMYVRDARKLCPALQLVPYDFASYEAVSIQIYARFFQLPGACVEAVSVDEAYLDLTLSAGRGDTREADGTDRMSQAAAVDAAVKALRDDIFNDTGCTASAGIGPSKLLARLATKTAKPNGQFRVVQRDVLKYLDTLSVSDLPGIGWRTKRRFQEMRITTVPQLRALPLARLQREFGEKQGSVFHDLCRGVDNRPVEPLRPRRSIGAEASWGIRFVAGEDDKVLKFFNDMTDEVAGRVNSAGAYGTRVVLKIYRRVPNSDMTGYKHLGHGPCTIVTRSSKLPRRLVGDALKKELRELCFRMFKTLRLGYEELRGVGIQVSELTFADLSFDGTSAAATGTRRIDSFFGGGAGGGASGKRSSNGQGQAKAKDGTTSQANQKEKRAQASGMPKRKSPESRGSEGGSAQKETTHQEHSTNGVEPSKSQAEEEQNGRGSKVLLVEDSDEEDEIRPASNPQARRGRDAVVVAEEEDEIRPASIPEPPRSPGAAEQVVPDGDAEAAETSAEQRNDDVTRPLDETATEHAQQPANPQIPAGWDVSVFKALPKELQAELLRDSARPVPDTGPSRRQTTLQNGRRGTTTAPGTRGRRPAVGGAERRPKRRRGGAVAGGMNGAARGQITMTQFAQIKTLRRTGNDVLHAAEFRDKPLREVVDLLHDLQGGTGVPKKRALSGASGAERRDGADEELDDDGSLDIPSPPSLSSDSECEYDGAAAGSGAAAGTAVERAVGQAARRGADGAVFADEAVWQEAGPLRAWMRATAHDVRSAHVELVRARAAELARRGKLSRTAEELRMLRRFALDAGGGWPTGFDRVLRDVQTALQGMHGYTLAVAPIGCGRRGRDGRGAEGGAGAAEVGEAIR